MDTDIQDSACAHNAEMQARARFPFGANWARFLRLLDDERIGTAEQSLLDMLKLSDLKGRRFLDAGSGSGLFSLAARRLGAQVHSFDYDPQSVACTNELRRRHVAQSGRDDAAWTVQQGSVLDEAYVLHLPKADIVYSWGVLHHTGEQWKALRLVSSRVASGGLLFIALYNDQGWLSSWWTGVKKRYNRHLLWRWVFIALYTPYFIWARWLFWKVRGWGGTERGMSLWYDLLDWLGGYPFEVSKPEQVFDFLQQQGFELRRLFTAGGRHGCNQFVFQRMTAPQPDSGTSSTRA